ncbi:MAG: alpha/beta fold hydrolase [Verrucomicrobia bacterium]|jgi:pimeloyl-ACP methyl ester carboxylesterase|nr:alpha/beta fold hydrolase [Verrucomicrobiota bacterium]
MAPTDVRRLQFKGSKREIPCLGILSQRARPLTDRVLPTAARASVGGFLSDFAASLAHALQGFPPLPVSTVTLLVALLAGCTTPIGADKVTTRQAYAQVGESALLTGKPGADTVALLHRFDLDRLAARHPDEAVRLLHQKARDTGERDLLFALAEMSYVAGEHIRRGVQPWDPRDARDYYLGSAVYAWLFLFGEGGEAPPGCLDRRFRQACEFYNYGLGLALTERRSTNGVVRLQEGRRRLPAGALNLKLNLTNFPARIEEFDQFLLADQFRVRGLTVRNREPGVGAPLLAVRRFDPSLGVRRCSPATVFLRLPRSLAEVDAETHSGLLELYSAFGDPTVIVGGSHVALETDSTTHAAYALNQSFVWDLGMIQFLTPAKQVRSQLIALDFFTPDRIPVVFVHGTFSSPVTWAEMNNTLAADPVLRRRCQFWHFMYGSGNPLPVSAGELRDALTAKVQELDPEGTHARLHQMVIIGHSQGGLLTKLTATTTGDRLWSVLSTNRIEDLQINEDERARLQHLLFLDPLPFVSRVVFISTPHRGSYLSGSFARGLVRRLMSLPSDVVSGTAEILALSEGSEVDKFLRGKMPTSLDSMSPKNPALLRLADIPVDPAIQAHSIIPVKGEGDYHRGRDGVVSYQSAHVDYVESELVVRGEHSCQDLPATIEEVRRILRLHLTELDSQSGAARNRLQQTP